MRFCLVNVKEDWAEAIALVNAICSFKRRKGKRGDLSDFDRAVDVGARRAGSEHVTNC